MKSTSYYAAMTIAILSLATPMTSANTKRLTKGRAGFIVVRDTSAPAGKMEKKSEERMKTVGLSIESEQREARPMRVLFGGRNNAVYRRVRR